MSKTKSQDPVTSHIHNQPSSIQPAFSAFHEYSHIELNHRNQLPGLSGAYVNYSASFVNLPLSKHSKTGILLSNDVSGGGVFKNTKLSTYYNFHTPTGFFSEISFVLQPSIYMYNFQGLTDINKPDWADFEKTEGISGNTYYIPDFSASVACHFKHLYTGFQVKHFYNFSKVIEFPLSLSFLSEYTFLYQSPFKNEATKIKPLLYIEMQNENIFLQTGAGVENSKIGGGIYYRQFKSPDFSSTIILSSTFYFLNLYIMYSFDVMLKNSYLTFNKFGIHEVTLGYKLEYKEKIKSKNNTINCP